MHLPPKSLQGFTYLNLCTRVLTVWQLIMVTEVVIFVVDWFIAKRNATMVSPPPFFPKKALHGGGQTFFG